MKRLLFFLSIILGLSGCIANKPIQPLMTNIGSMAPDVSKWQDYGAVYDYDELRIITDIQYGSGFTTTSTINRKLRILNREGIRYGTLQIPHLKGSLHAFEVKLVNADGIEQTINVGKIRKQYLKTEKVIVPRVEPGCEISLRISFNDNAPVSSYDHLHGREIPVLKSRFTFLYGHDLKYKYKSYGISNPIQELKVNYYKGFQVDGEEILPTYSGFSESQFFSAANRFADIPRTAVAFDSVLTHYYRYQAADWKKIAEECERFYFEPSTFTSSRKIEEIVRDISDYITDDFSKADRILSYVQKNFSLQPIQKKGSSVNTDSVLRSKVGNTFEISVLLAEMFSAAGLECNKYLARSRLRGGFDPDFPSWNQLQIPLVSVVAGGREYLAFPFVRDYELGEYPLDLMGEFGLNLTKRKAIALPEAVYRDAVIMSEANVSLAAPDVVHSWRFSLGNHFSSLTRAFFANAGKDAISKAAKTFLKEYSEQHNLTSSYMPKNLRGKDVLLQIRFTNDNLAVEHKDGTHYSLSQFFKKHFTEYLDAEPQPLVNDLEIAIEESITLQDVPEAKTKIKSECKVLDNPLFQTECFQTKNKSDWTIRRVLKVKEVDLTSEQLAALRSDIMQLNSIGESFAFVKVR